MLLPVTSLYAGLITLLVIALAARIPPMRRRYRVGIHSGQNEDLARAVRVHGNAVENVPLGLILLGLLELQAMNAGVLHALGSLFFLGRILHAWGLSRTVGVSAGRVWGMTITWLTLITMAGMLLWLALSHNL